MKKYLSTTLAIIFCLLSSYGFSQLNGYKYRTEYTITEVSSVDKVDFQILLRLNTRVLVDNGLLRQDANDLRFSHDCDGSNLLDYFIEDAVPGSETKIWVKLPLIPAGRDTILYMFYGNPAATAGNNFDATFPKNTRFDPVLGLGGPDYSWFEIPQGYNFELTEGEALQVNARRIRINGTINGNAAGQKRGTLLGAGKGEGGGAAGSNGAGGGGGGHGGSGGTGNPGILGGVEYDTFDSDTAFMGSGGGAGGIANGGNGGGAVLFNGRLVDINYSILLNGENGHQGTDDVPAGGGGAGGGALIKGKEVRINADIEANGGNSGQTFPNSNGGGGAGGRIKVFYEDVYENNGTFSVNGGEPGIESGGHGQRGTTYISTYVSDEPIITIVGTVPLFIELSSSGTNDSICNGSAESIDAPLGFDNYNFIQIGFGSVQNGPLASYGSSTFNNGDQFYVEGIVGGCTTLILSDTITINVVDITTASYTANGLDLDWEFTSTSTGNIQSYLWDFDDGTTSTEENPMHSFSGAGVYNVSLSTFGELPCATSTSIMPINVTCLAPTPDYSYTNDELTLSFTDLSSNADTVIWYSPDDTTFKYNVRNPVHTFQSPGTYQICMTIENYCQTITLCRNINVTCTEPVANFSIITDELDITLVNNSTSGETYKWNTEGFSSNLETPSGFSYPDRGTYEICLKVWNFCGVDSVCKDVTVNCAPPVTDFSFTQSNSTCRFTDLTGNAVKWRWDYSDGSVDTVQNPFHVFETLGNFLVCLTATNACGDFFTKCYDLTVTSLSTNITELELEDVSVYPNPVKDDMVIELPEKSNSSKIELYDVTGKMVLEKPLKESQTHLNVEGLNKGVYILKLRSDTSQKNFRIVKE